MKKILIGTAVAGMIVGTFASLSFAAPLPPRQDTGISGNIIAADARCDPHGTWLVG